MYFDKFLQGLAGAGGVGSEGVEFGNVASMMLSVVEVNSLC